jgi:hypothetical protein
VGKYANIHEAIYKLPIKDTKKYQAEWLRRHPRKEKFWDRYIQPYVRPSYMLYCAPPIQVYELIELIAENNKFEMPYWNAMVSTFKCPECELDVTALYRDVCFRCYEKSII